MINAKNKNVDNKTKLIILYALFFVIILLIDIFVVTVKGDDIFGLNKYSKENIFSVIYRLYLIHESRCVIRFVVLVFCKLPYKIWRIVNAFVYPLMVYYITKMFFKKENRFLGSIIVFGLLMSFDLAILSSAGWLTTTIFYSWVALAAIISIYGLKKLADGKSLSKTEMICYGILTIFAANMEQMCLILFAVYGFFVILSFMRKNVKIYPIIILILIVCEILFILTCPGNNQRTQKDINTWFPEFANFNLIDKFHLGVFSLCQSFNTWLFIFAIMFLILIMFFSYIKNKGIVPKFLSIVNIILIMIMHIRYPQYISSSIPNIGLGSVRSINQGYRNFDFPSRTITLSTQEQLILELLMIFLIISVTINLYLIVKDSSRKLSVDGLIVCGIFLLGLLTKFMMGFTPTVWASRDRSGYFLFLSILFVIVILLKDWDYKNKEATFLLVSSTSVIGLYQLFSAILTSTLYC